MPSTYNLIASNTLGASAASVTFSSIPATYTDLLIVYSIRGDAAYETNNADALAMRINGSSSAEYAVRAVRGQSSNADSLARTTGNADAFVRTYGGVVSNSFTANTFSSGQVYIPNYRLSPNKAISTCTVVPNNSAITYVIAANAQLWQNTSVINSLEFIYTFNASSRFVTGSSFYLYGIKNS
jgi:hypothetical protein